MDGNSLVFDSGEQTDESIDFIIPVQPQVDKDSAEIQNLDTTSSVVKNSGALLTLIQFILTYMLNSSLSFFFALINS